MISRGRTPYEIATAVHALDWLGTDAMTTDRTHKSPEDWWSTSIIDMKPGSIRIRGYAIEELIGRVGFVDMIYLMNSWRASAPGCRPAPWGGIGCRG